MSHHKTDEACDCGWLSGAINDPDSSVFFDSSANRIMMGSPSGSQYVMYCCPYCGGRFPVERPMWVPIVPDDERTRMAKLIEGLDSSDAIIDALGTPDCDQYDYPWNHRNIEYNHLSEWFNVECWIKPDGATSVSLVIKPLSPR